MRKYTNLILSCTIIASCLVGLWGSVAFAATKTKPKVTSAATANDPTYGEALEIAPPIITLTVNRGQSLTTKIYLRDISNGPLYVTGQANDFVADNETGTPKILLGNQDANDPYSMKNWIVPPPSLNLIQNEIKTMNVVINVPANASPGGHYAVLRFTATPPALKNSGVSLSTSLGALILLTVNGKITHNLSVAEFSVNKAGKTGKLFQSGPLNFVERIKNNGNVQEEPTGHVTIKDMFGKTLTALNVNIPPHNILPASIRMFSEPLNQTVIGNKRLFGLYHATMNLTYGPGSSLTLNAQTSFWVLPYKLILIVIIVLVGGFFLLRYLLRRYNRHVIKQSSKTTHHRQ